MRDFYGNVGEMDMKKDFHALRGMGLEPSHQSNMMMARAENKAMIANGWINKDGGQQVTNSERHNRPQGPKDPKGPKGGQTPGDPQVIAMLRQYGLQPTGSREGDLQALMKAMNGDFNNMQNINNNSKADKAGKKGGNRPPPQTPPAVSAFMRSIGLQPTNSKEGDYTAITTKLQELEAQAKSDPEKQKVDSLRATFASLI